MAGIAPARILQVCSSLAWGGTEMHVPILSGKLRDRGHDVRLVLHPKGSIAGEAREQGFTVETVPIGGYVNPLSTCALRRYIRRFRPAVLHLHLSRDLWQAVPAARLAGFGGPLLLTKHVGSYVTKKDPLHRWLYRRVSRVITVSETLNRNVRETCPVPPDRVVTVHPALDLERFDPSLYDREDTRRSLGIVSEAMLVGTVGRVSPGKGYEEFLQAARMLRDRHPEMSLRFVVVGEASYGEEAYHVGIVQRARELGLGESVLFTGFRRDIPALLNAMDVFIFPSRAEGFGATVIEAMAMGVACVSTRSDGTLDTVEEGETGLVFQGGDAEGLAQSVESLLMDERLRERIAETGRARARARFNLDTMTDRVEALYAASMAPPA
ncbi:MAG: glycosyltransferase family 4 protein [Gemmatimonadetes bacterium]|nr:glycosyltransferase family 4 protein [Gemmatimonadota bacterium]MYD26145.1 glycosyltransferase family 4 protein [Gemmatimonadota bacterium]MYJ00604.1 glycosyltransferase family 4 protein [Gemmatimonadota bacterium]